MSMGNGSTWPSVLAWVLAPIGGIGGIGAVVWWALGKPSFKQVRRYVKSFIVERAVMDEHDSLSEIFLMQNQKKLDISYEKT